MTLTFTYLDEQNTQYTIKNVPVIVVFFSMLLLRFFFLFRLKKLFHLKNGLTTSLLFFFFESAKNLGRWDDAKRRKKRGWPNQV